MKQFFITVGGVFAGLLLFGAFVVFSLFGLLASSATSASERAQLHHPTVLELDLRSGLTDQDPAVASFLSPGKLSVMRIIATLRHAESDDRVKSVLVRLPEGGIAPAQADELRLAFIHFRRAGKPIMAHSQGLYPSGLVISTYELAAATGEIWMQSDAAFEATGISTSELFLKRAFDKYGIKADYEQRYEYKNAVNPYLHDDYTPAHREATLSWMGAVFDNALSQAAKDRKLDATSLKAVIQGGPYSAPQAVEKRLIDKLGQVHDAEIALKDRAGDGTQIVDFQDYANTVSEDQGSGKSTIAVIGAEGDIVTGRGGGSLFTRNNNIYSDDESRAFYDAIKDKDVKAIVFRVSSPGGSPTASEQIGSAMRAAKAAGKPVVVSMGDYAASGGYWIAADASAIVAEPSTITGSIGVFGGKFAIGDALGRFGLDLRDLSVGGQYADAFSGSQSFTPAQRAAFAAGIDRIYDGFIQRVSIGRRLPEARVREIAKGRVWTGAQAQPLGLVDQLGGFYEAVDKAKALSGIPASEDVRLKRYPHPKGLFESLFKGSMAPESAIKALAATGWIMGDPHASAVLDQMADARLRRDQHAAVLAPRVLPRD